MWCVRYNHEYSRRRTIVVGTDVLVKPQVELRPVVIHWDTVPYS